MTAVELFLKIRICDWAVTQTQVWPGQLLSSKKCEREHFLFNTFSNNYEDFVLFIPVMGTDVSIMKSWIMGKSMC